MKIGKTIIAAILVLNTGMPALADQTAAAANLLLVAQIGDVVTTRLVLSNPAGREADPIAKPFVHSNIGLLATALVVNVAARTLFKRAPNLLRIAAFVEGALIVNNANVIMNTNTIPTQSPNLSIRKY